MRTSIIPKVVYSRGGTQHAFSIRPAAGLNLRDVSRVYNCVIDPENERGLEGSPELIEQRLEFDPECIPTAVVDGIPQGCINVTKRSFLCMEEIRALAPTAQRLTVYDSNRTTDPENGNVWFCTWVAVAPEARGLKAEVLGGPRSLGQLLALHVREQALERANVSRLFAHSRPGGLRAFLEDKMGSRILFERDSIGRITGMRFEDGRQLSVNDKGVDIEGMSRLTLSAYWDMRDEKGRRVDPVFQFHGQNGAEFVEGGTFPGGQRFDGNSLTIRQLLEYSLR